MNNEKVLTNFILGLEGRTQKRIITSGCYYYEGYTLQTDGARLVNYSTCIAYHEDGAVIISNRKYSRTTSTIQSQIKRLCERKGVLYTEKDF